MSKITNITVQEKNKNRCNIFIDGDFFIALSKELVYKYSLKEGLELEDSQIAEIRLESEKSDALSKAINYVSKSLKTKKQVVTYLTGKGYSLQTVNYCIDKLKEYSYIDDFEFAKRYIEFNSNNQGKHLLSYKMMMKGVSKQLIESAFEECGVNSKENALSVAEKRLKNKDITNELLSKTYRYLISKGFSYDDANYAIDKFKEKL